MKTLQPKFFWLCILHFSFCISASAQGTAFTYQGRLNDGANPANGSFDLRFGLFPAAGGALQIAATTNSAVLVTNGLFTVLVDLGSNAFSSANWLEIGARPSGNGAFATLSPRQQITPTPYAIRAANFSGTLSASQLPGVVTNGATNLTLSGKFTGTLSGSSTGAFTGTFIGNGGGLTNLNLTTLGGLTAADFWQLNGNNVSSGQILGSANNEALQFVVNGFNALRLEPNSSALPNVIGGNGNSVGAGNYAVFIGGGFANSIDTNATETVIAGGGFNNIGSGSYNAAIGGGGNNKIQTNSSNAAIPGGEGNGINNSSHSFIAGGLQNNLLGGNTFSTIGGGNANTLLTGANYGVICGGRGNTNGATTSTIAGGQNNTVQALADRSFIGGGLQNSITGAGGVVPGGFANSAGSQAFAAGRRAKANDSGSFVWGDSTDADIASGGINSVTFRAAGGYRLFSSTDTTPPSPGVSLAAGTSAWGTISDRNAKKNFAPVDGQAVLEKLAAVPVQYWNYLWEADGSVPNLGPMAQDFKAAFYPGRNDKIITTLEFDGVELAAIQGLNQKLEETRAENAALKHELAAIKQLLTKISERNN